MHIYSQLCVVCMIMRLTKRVSMCCISHVSQWLVSSFSSFDLSKPISVEEAIFALDYIDHDFYVFRDGANDEISVVYKRNAGGVGLIQPQQ